jgi:hypothetical protein
LAIIYNDNNIKLQITNPTLFRFHVLVSSTADALERKIIDADNHGVIVSYARNSDRQRTIFFTTIARESLRRKPEAIGPIIGEDLARV